MSRQLPHEQRALSTQPVNVSRRPFMSSKARPQPNRFAPSAKSTKTATPKSCFELAYEESLSQVRLLEEKLRQQALLACQLERNALEYYYTNDICFEDYDGEDIPQQNSGLHHYYFTSVICQARRERRERHAREEEQLQNERRRVQLLEDDVRDHLINGALAEHRREVEDSEKENNALQQHLAGKLLEEETCRESLSSAEERQKEAHLKQQESAARIQQLEEGRRRQMEDADATRLLLGKEREELAAAQAELQKREKVVNDLRATIGQLTRKRRQRD